MKDLYYFTECPYCEEGKGEIAIEITISTAMIIASRRPGNNAPPVPNQTRMVFNSGCGDGKPCKHLLQIFGNCSWAWFPKIDARTGLLVTRLAWNHPSLKGANRLDATWHCVSKSFDLASSSPLVHVEVRRHQNCTNPYFSQGVGFEVQVEGLAWFARDVKKFRGDMQEWARTLYSRAQNA